MRTAETLSIRAYEGARAAGYGAMMRTAGYGTYRHVLDAVAAALRLNPPPEKAVVVDLGCGTGNLSLRVLRELPRAWIIGVDGSEGMLKKARLRLRGKSAGFFRRDFGRIGWEDGLPSADVVVSSGAIHHLPGLRKRALYAGVYSLLNPGGMFMNGDIIRGATPRLGRMYEDFWVGMIAEGLTRLTGRSPGLEKVRVRHRAMQRDEGDSPSTLGEQLAWLRECGFAEVECYWKLFGFAVFGGKKQGR